MKYLLFLFCLLLLPTAAEAQTYYVAKIEGKVSYNGKLLAKRDKINASGKLAFAKENAYIKVVGPGGIFTFRAEKRDEKGEFVTALSEELFPTIKMKGSFAFSLAVIKVDEKRPHYFFWPTSEPTRSPSRLGLDSLLLSRADDLYLMASFEGRILTTSANIVEDSLVLTNKPFRGAKPDTVSIVLVNDYTIWNKLKDMAPSSAAIEANIRSHSLPLYGADSSLVLAPVEKLNSFFPEILLSQKVVRKLERAEMKRKKKKLRRHEKALDEVKRQLAYLLPSSPDDFLDDEDIKAFFKAEYGIENFSDGLISEYVNGTFEEKR